MEAIRKMFDILFKKIVFISIKSPTFSIVGVGGHSHVSLSVEYWGLSIYNVQQGWVEILMITLV